MLIGYTILDPIVVLSGTLLSIWLLARNPPRLIAFLPAALTLYFFIPMVTLLTMWRAVTLLLVIWVLLRGRISMPKSLRPAFGLLVLALFLSSGVSFVEPSSLTRTVIRLAYYMGVFALFIFAHEMGRRPETLRYLIRGFATLGALLAIYGLYQVVAHYTGLPFRGIVYGPGNTKFPVINGLPRINSLANEPKRLGFVLFVGALAFFEMARTARAARRTRYHLYGAAIIAVSVLTFSSSYFLALAIFGASLLLLYPKGSVRYVIPIYIVGGIFALVANQLGILDALTLAFDDRFEEIQLGLDASVIYRQEFYAQDYLINHPLKAITGVGLGGYYAVLNAEYGTGVGINQFGGLVPLNSMLFELIFDLGGLATLLFYSLLVILALKLRRARLHFLVLALVFLTLQSLSIQTLHFLVLVAGVGLGQLRLKQQPN